MSDLDVSYVLREPIYLERCVSFLRGNWQRLAQEGKPLVCHIFPESSKRSLEQNRYYWRLLTDIADNAWVFGRQFHKDAWHEEFRMTFLPKLETPTGYCAVSTASLSVKDMAEYISKIEVYACETLGLEI
jgi:NinB protein